jgi:hypothetical protein
MGSGVVFASIALGIAITLLLWYLVARRASSIAKWIVVLLFLFSLLTSLGVGSGGISASEAVSLVALLLQAAAVYFLFRPDAKAWFAGTPAAPGPTEAPPQS